MKLAFLFLRKSGAHTHTHKQKRLKLNFTLLQVYSSHKVGRDSQFFSAALGLMCWFWPGPPCCRV